MIRQATVLKYKKSRRPFKKTDSQVHLEVFKANKFKNLLKTALNKKLMDTLQEEITSSKAGSARGKSSDPSDQFPIIEEVDGFEERKTEGHERKHA